jgi:hypothetical protein
VLAFTTSRSRCCRIRRSCSSARSSAAPP